MKKQDYQQARASYLHNATQILVDGLLDATAVGYVKQTDDARRAASYIIFHGKQSKPAKYYSAPTLEAAVREATKELTRQLGLQQQRAAQKAQDKATGRAAYSTDERNGITRRSYTTAGTAELIRQALRKAFPGQKFSVTSEVYSMGSTVHVTYTDGPATEAVKAITNEFRAGDFDGMQDYYDYREPSVLVDEAGPYYASYGAKYVSVHRSFSPAFGLWLHALDLRQPLTLSEQVEAFLSWHRGRCQYNEGRALHHETGSWLLSSPGGPEDLKRFAGCLEQQGLRTEMDFEDHTYYLGIYCPKSHCEAA